MAGCKPLFRIVVFAVLMAACAGKTPTALKNAEAILDYVTLTMKKVKKEATAGNSAIANHIEELKEAWDEKKKKALQMMKIDAEVNGVPVSSLDPKTYGLGEDPLLALSKSPEHSREATYVRMAACAQQVINILHPPQNRRLLEEAKKLEIHTNALAKVTKFKMEKMSAQTEAQVDKKIVDYLQKAAENEDKKEAEFQAEEKAAEAKTAKVSFGTAGTPVMNTLNKLTAASKLFEKTFIPVMAQSKKMSKIAAKAIDAITSANILTATAPPSAFKFFKLQKMFQSCATKLRMIIPLSVTFNNQYHTIKTTIADEKQKLKKASKSDAARRLNIALQSPKFMEETREYKVEATMGKEGIVLARKVEAVAKQPGTGWMAHNKGSSRRLEETQQHHPIQQSFSKEMVFGFGIASGFFTFLVAVSGHQYMSKNQQTTNSESAL